MIPSRRLLFTAVGILTTLFGALLLSAPSLESIEPVAILLNTVDILGPELIFLVIGLCLVGYLGLALRTPTDSTDVSSVATRFERRIGQPPESVTVNDNQLAGWETDQHIDSAISEGGEDLRLVQKRLRTLAITIYGQSMNTTEPVARNAVATGDWCEDPTAATFLAADPHPPLEAQLRLLMFPAAERHRRIERTIAAIEAAEGSI